MQFVRFINVGLLCPKRKTNTLYKYLSTDLSTTTTTTTTTESSVSINESPEEKLELKSNFLKLIESEPKETLTFAKMFRHSKFVSLGDLQNKFLIGRVIEVVGDDLYIDYGGKFNCVCKRPEKNAGLYKRNANVLIKLIDFEMASYFLSAAKHLTLHESNASLIGLFDQDQSLDKNDSRNILLKNEINDMNSESIF